MCTIDKLLIKGIRSFSPENKDVIEFYRPLTIIVGSNGAGKTTIIECLRQATTGEMPPNTRSGQSFVHDPKVANEQEVKAQIKMRFHTSMGQPVVVQRSFQLTQKKQGLTFKTLDSLVQTINRETGEKNSVTMKCADIDALVPTMMGVSKAVLDSVIFVHQEESNWPLSEGKVLKDKFDEIFAATKYTKALEVLRKLRMEKVQSVKVLKADLETVKTRKDQASKLRKEIADGQAQVADKVKRIDELGVHIEGLSEQLRALDTKLQTLGELGDQATKTRLELSMVKKQEADMRTKVQEMVDNDEDVEATQAYLAQFHNQMDELAAEIDAFSRDARGKRMEKEQLNDHYQRDCLRHGRLQAEATANASSVAERDRFLRATAQQLGLILPEGAVGTESGVTGHALLPASAVDALQGALAGRRRDLERNLQELKANNRIKDSKMSEAVDSKTTQITRGAEAVRMKREQLAAQESTIESVYAQMAGIQVSEALIDEINERTEATRARMQAKSEEEARSGLDGLLSTERNALDDLHRRISNLRQERERVSAASESSTRLKLKRQEVATREEQLHNLVNSKRSRLVSLLGGGALPAYDQIREAVERQVEARRQELQVRGNEMRELQKQQSQYQGQLSTLQAQLAREESALAAVTKQMSDGMARATTAGLQADAPVPELLTKAEQEVEKINNKLGLSKGLAKLTKSYKAGIQVGAACPVCCKPFHNEAEVQTAIQHLDSEFEDFPRQITERTQAVAMLRSQIGELTKLQPLHARYNELREKDVPALRERLTALRAQGVALEQSVQDACDQYASCDLELADATRLVNEHVRDIDRMHRELNSLRAEVRRLEQDASATAGSVVGSYTNSLAGGGISGIGGPPPGPALRTVTEVDSDLEDAERERAAHERTRDELQRRQAKLKDDMLSAQAAYMAAQGEGATALATLQRKRDMEAKVKELEASCVDLRSAMSSLEAAQRPLLDEREVVVAEREAMRTQSATAEATLDNQVREVVLLTEQMAAKLRPVAEYEGRGKGPELARATASLEETKRRMDSTQQELVALEDGLKLAQEKLLRMEGLKRAAEDFLQYKAIQAQVSTLEARAVDLKAQAAAVGNQMALADAHRKAMEDKDSLRNQSSVVQGMKASLQLGMERASRDLADSAYRDIEAKYRRAYVEVKTIEMANADLDKYHKALEKALQVFHTSKMSDINKVIKEMWQKTYRGQDIDYIQIKADADGARSFNYRVVMLSGATELDMRGRCSAGQKVLACLIIRLALAETFCLNCGILALDEPTTNLDAENSASLAESLRAVMASRREQENFQLVVITHDEAFARLIGTREHAEWRWRVTKDEDQHTKVVREEIADE